MIGNVHVQVRDATAADAVACAAIYAPYVLETVISFELVPPTAAEMAERIAASYAWVVAEAEGAVLGYAYAGQHKARPAYQWSCEVSVYLQQGHQRAGIGRTLYEALFDRLVALGYRTALAGITVPNEASTGLHRAVGFEPVGVFRRIGWKHGAWRDVAWMQRDVAHLWS